MKEVTFTPDLQDLLAYGWLDCAVSIRPALLTVLFTVGIGIGRYYLKPDSFPFELIILPLGLILCYWHPALLFCTDRMMRSQLDQNEEIKNVVLSERTVTLSSEGIAIAIHLTGEVERFLWKEVKIVASDNHIFFIRTISRSEPGTFIPKSRESVTPIPRRAFPTQQDFEAFLDTARQLRNSR